MEAGEDESWSPGPTRAEAAPRLWPPEPGTGAARRTKACRQRQQAPQPAPTVRAHGLPHLREPPNEASASPRKRTAAVGQWDDGLAKGAGLARRPRPRVRRVGAEPGSRQVVPGVRGGGACGAGRGGEGAASGRRARAARAGGSRGGARPPARAPGGGHCAAPLSAVRARGAHRASAALTRPACPGPTCGGRRGRGAPSAAEPHEQ